MSREEGTSTFPPGAAESELQAPENLQEVESCSICGASERTVCFREPPFQVVRCGACGLVYVTPRLRPEILLRVYDGSYWKSESPSTRGYADYAGDAPLYLKTFEKRMGLVEHYVAGPGRALDVGCAAGFFLKVLRDRGWEADGVELSPDIATHAREAYGFPHVHVGELDTAPFPEASYDLVTLWDLVEHVPDPVALLRRAVRFLREGGHLVVETQNVASLFARLLGQRWQHYKHLEHLYHFQPDTLARLLRQAGLEIVASTWRYAGKHVSLGFVRERAGRLHPSMSRLLRPLAPFDGLSLYVNPGDEIIAVARTASSARGRAG